MLEKPFNFQSPTCLSLPMALQFPNKILLKVDFLRIPQNLHSPFRIQYAKKLAAFLRKWLTARHFLFISRRLLLI